MGENTKEWLESRKKLKERKKREAVDGRATNRPYSASRWGFEEQIVLKAKFLELHFYVVR